MQSFFRAIVAFFQWIWLFLAGLVAPPAAKPVDPPVIAPPENPQVICMDDFSLLWQDMLDGDTLDLSKWTGFRASF